MAIANGGVSIKEIVRRTGYSRGLVRRIARGERGDVFRVRESSLEVYLPLLENEWAAGCRNGAELWRRLKLSGFRGSLRVVTEWATRRRQAERVPALIDARKLIERFHTLIRRKSEADLLPWIEEGGASLVASFANGVARDIAAVRAATVTA